LDTYLRQRAKDNLAKGPTTQMDVVMQDPGRVDMRFQDVPTQPVPVMTRGLVQGKTKKPKKGRSGEQEMGVV
jgi:hypothetical protein